MASDCKRFFEACGIILMIMVFTWCWYDTVRIDYVYACQVQETPDPVYFVCVRSRDDPSPEELECPVEGMDRCDFRVNWNMAAHRLGMTTCNDHIQSLWNAEKSKIKEE